MSDVRNRLAEKRQARGIAASDLARRTGVSRQTIYAIEAGSYVPNTEVALRLARELEVSVEDLFSLEAAADRAPQSVSAEVLSAQAVAKGQAVRICRVGEHTVGIPVSAKPYYLPESDGVVVRASGSKASVVAFGRGENTKRLVLAGCDPATGLLARVVERTCGVEIVAAAAASRLALDWLNEGKVHIAGSHLEDPASGEFNLPFVDRTEMTVIAFARWEEGWVTAPGNPRGIHDAGDLVRRGVRFINREAGSGARGLFERLLRKAGVPVKKVMGSERVAYGHLAAAYAVASAEADCCLATRAAAQTFGLDFVPVAGEQYDLILSRKTLETPAAQVFVDVLQRSELRRKLEMLAGYDTSEMGRVRV